MLMGRTSKKQIDEVQKCTSSICCPFVLLPALGNIRNTVCSCPDLWLHPPKDNIWFLKDKEQTLCQTNKQVIYT